MYRRKLFALKGLLAGVALALLPSVGLAGTAVTYTDGDTRLFQIEVPDFWSLRTGGLRDLAGPEGEGIRDISRVFGMTPDAHPGVWVGLISPHGVTTLAEARDYLQDIGPFLVSDASVSAPQPRRINGMPASRLSGEGRRAGRDVTFTVLAVDLPGSRVAIAVVVFEAGAVSVPIADINAMLASLRAIR